MKYKVPLWVKSSFTDDPGTLVCEEDKAMENVLVSGIALTRDESRFVVRSVPDKPGVAAKVFGTLDEQGHRGGRHRPDSREGGRPHGHGVHRRPPRRGEDQRPGAEDRESRSARGKVDHEEGIAKVTIVGVGMRNHCRRGGEDVPGARGRRGQHPGDHHSEIKVSCVIDEKYAELAVRALHTAFGLDKTDTAKS